ncbi:hypothetical protein HanRHA438_Chr09g0378161 [Helianthus annuus]|nr:hypothetical protein HanRHA438_Chr09g0378161 [Helianthus annuus]
MYAMVLYYLESYGKASNSIREETGDKLERLGSKLTTNSKD